LFNWVAYPITVLIQSIYENEMLSIREDQPPCAFRLELLAALERTLCFCHTGNTAALATSLMNPLGLSRAVVRDGFPMLHKTFTQPAISSAMERGFQVDKRVWPMKGGFPAIASKRAQILTYSLGHFMVSRSFCTCSAHLSEAAVSSSFLGGSLLIFFGRHIKPSFGSTMPSKYTRRGRSPASITRC
jgi:hypothetical protein